MATYTKISELTAATVLGGTEQIPCVQSAATVVCTPAQISTYVNANPPSGITATSVVTGEYIFDEDSELDYSTTVVNGMSAQAVTFSELPSTTREILTYLDIRDASLNPYIQFKRSSGGTLSYLIAGQFADAGASNWIRGLYWLPTHENSIYIETVNAGQSPSAGSFVIVAYKVGG